MIKTDKNKKIIVTIVVLLTISTLIGISYAYFAVLNGITGNDKNLNIVTEELGSIKWTGTKVFTSDGLLPGEMGLQTFTIEKNSASGKGIYEIDLKGIIDEAFNEDVEITLYKSTDESNNVTIKEGESTISGDDVKQYYKEDSVVLNGTPEKVYGVKALQNKDQIILEQADFDNTTLQKTTYYLVYHYKNADGDQNAQQGKSFSGEISVRLILDKDKSKVIGSICKNDPDSASCSVAKLANTNSDIVVVDDFDNVRYIGADPNNYVGFADRYESNVYQISGSLYGKKDVESGIFESLDACQNYAKEQFSDLISDEGRELVCQFEYVKEDNNVYTIFLVDKSDVEFTDIETKNFDTDSDCQDYIAEKYNENIAKDVKCSLLHAKGDIEKYELWRIIGVMHSVDDGTGNKSDRIKMVKDSSIGSYSWDTSDSSVNNGYGVNEWSQSKLMKLLNPGYESETIGGSLYWNNSSGKCYNGANNASTACNFTTGGMRNELKELIGEALWNTGAISGNVNTKEAYELERSNASGKICTSKTDQTTTCDSENEKCEKIVDYCNDKIERTTTWVGKVGLIYPSDYGYSTSGGNDTSRDTCLNSNFGSWHQEVGYEEKKDCSFASWITKFNTCWSCINTTKTPVVTLTSVSDSDNATQIYSTSLSGSISDIYSCLFTENYVLPTVYLKSNVKIASGVGSESDPFILEL